MKPQGSSVETTAPRPLTIFELELQPLLGEEASTQPTNSLGIQNVTVTPPKFNMEPENKSLEKESPFGTHYFQVPCQISGV